MNFIEVVVLGLVQGLTEFIPVSSSGHLVIAHELFGTSSGTLVLDVALHVGTLLALVVYFWQDIVNLLTNLFKSNSTGRLARVLIVATIPAAITGFLFQHFIDDHLRKIQIVALTTALVALIMLWADRQAEKTKEVNINKGLVIGVAQTAALIPGVSRSGATITAGRFLGLDRLTAARFSFLLAMPIIVGSAAGVFLDARSQIGGELGTLALGALVSFVSGLMAIKFLMNYLGKHSLAVFAYYRLALAAVLFVWLIVR